jgi:hypothetical protein
MEERGRSEKRASTRKPKVTTPMVKQSSPDKLEPAASSPVKNFSPTKANQVFEAVAKA